METSQLNRALCDVTETQLSHLGRIANRVLAGRPLTLRGQHRRGKNSGRGTEFLDFRDYSPGDDLRFIDWRASARCHQPLVRRFHDEAASHWTICLDISASMSSRDKLNTNKWPLAIQLAASFAYLVLQQENKVGLLAFNDQLHAICPPGRGRLQYGKIRQQLHTLLPRHEGGSSKLQLCSKPIKRGSSLIIISDFLSPDAMQPDLDYLNTITDSIHALHIISPDECKLTPTSYQDSSQLKQHHLIRDVESGQQFHIHNESAEQVAEQRLHQHHNHLKNFCQAHGIHHTSCNTDQSWHQIISQHLQTFCQGTGRLR